MSQSPKGVRSGGPATQNQMEINNAILMAAASHNIQSQMTSSEFNFKVGKNNASNQNSMNVRPDLPKANADKSNNK